MTPQVEIRQALVTDLNDVERVERRSFPDEETFSRQQLRYLLEKACGACYVASLEGVVVGYISLLTRRTAGNLRIYSVAVDPAARGCGVAGALVERAIATARELGMCEVTLEVRVDNSPAIALYSRHGFYPGRLLRGYYPDGTDGQRMQLKIKN